MLDKIKNAAAIRLLIRELVLDRNIDREEVRLHCRTVVYACFLTEIEPHQLPISEHSKGDLSEYQKKQFWEQYLSLYLDNEGNRCGAIASMLRNEPTWLYLLSSADMIIDREIKLH